MQQLLVANLGKIITLNVFDMRIFIRSIVECFKTKIIDFKSLLLPLATADAFSLYLSSSLMKCDVPLYVVMAVVVEIVIKKEYV